MRIRITVVEDRKNPGWYYGHIWVDEQFYSSCPIMKETRADARKAAKEWAKNSTNNV